MAGGIRIEKRYIATGSPVSWRITDYSPPVKKPGRVSFTTPPRTLSLKVCRPYPSNYKSERTWGVREESREVGKHMQEVNIFQKRDPAEVDFDPVRFLPSIVLNLSAIVSQATANWSGLA